MGQYNILTETTKLFQGLSGYSIEPGVWKIYQLSQFNYLQHVKDRFIKS